MSAHPSEWDDGPTPDQWQRSIDRLRNLCDGLDVDALLVLAWLVRSRLVWLTCEQETLIDTRKLSGRVLEEARRFNSAARRRMGLPEEDAGFRRLMQRVTTVLPGPRP